MYYIGIQIPHGKVGWLDFNVPFQHKYGYIRDDPMGRGNFEGEGAAHCEV